MTTELEIGLYIFILAGFLGYHVITRVPPLLHTPLMSATNAISGISLIGSLVVAGANYSRLSTLLGFIAVTCSSTNVVGGFLITDRMLKMFKRREEVGIQHRRFSPKLLLAFPVLVIVFLVVTHWLRRSGTEPQLSSAALSVTALRYSYILSAVLFILGLKGLSSPKYARRGMFLAAFGMLMAIAGTLLHPEIVNYRWITVGLTIGTVVGGGMGLRIPMTAVPQRTALSHSLGALAASLIGISEYVRHVAVGLGSVKMTTIGLEVVIGSLTFTGSLMAAGKLQGLLPGAPITYQGQNVFNIALLATVVGTLIYLVFVPAASVLFFAIVGLALLFGFLLVIPIGAADMPVVIALLNSYGGLADASMGFGDEQDPDYYWLARRHFRLPTLAADVQSHESLGDERPVRRVRQNREGGGRCGCGGNWNSPQYYSGRADGSVRQHPVSHRRPGLWNGRRASSARGQ